MKHNPRAQAAILEAVANQLRLNKPAEARLTLKRLIEAGYSEKETKKLIGWCLSIELYQVMKSRQPYNEARYVANLKRLPEEPLEK